MKIKNYIFLMITIIGLISSKAGFTTLPASCHLFNGVVYLKSVEMNNQTEIWKTIEGFENYQISNLGRVRSLNFNQTKIKKVLRNGVSRGYLRVTLCPGFKHKRIHRLIAEAFIPNPNNKPLVLHKNDIKTDNSIENLYWGDCLENMKDRTNNGYSHSKETIIKMSKSTRGELNPIAKLTEKDVAQIKTLLNCTGISQSEIGYMFNVSNHTISHINTGKRWEHVKI